MGADRNVWMTLSLVMKVDSAITIRRRSVKVIFEFQEIIHSQVKFVDNVLLANIFFLIKFGFNTIIPLANGKTVTAKWYTKECLSSVLKQVENCRRPNDLIIHHGNASPHKEWNI